MDYPKIIVSNQKQSISIQMVNVEIQPPITYIKFHVLMVNDDKNQQQMLNYFIAVTILCLVIYLQTIESSPTESSEGRPVMPSPESPTITYTQQQQPKGEYHIADDSLLRSQWHPHLIYLPLITPPPPSPQLPPPSPT